MSLFNNDYFDELYYENGISTGKSGYENYRYMHDRSISEAKAFISYSGIRHDDFYLDVGCAKGFFVRSMLELGYNGNGCDISEYALSECNSQCWNCRDEIEWRKREGEYNHAFSKDVLEHCTKNSLVDLLEMIRLVADKFTCIVPIGENGKYLIEDYHNDKSHIIVEDVGWWRNTFYHNGWNVLKDCIHVNGLKDNWFMVNIFGNNVFHMEKR